MASYINDTEIANMYPNYSEFTTAQVEEAKEKSYGLVNSFLNSKLVLPAVSDSGDYPEILKIIQIGFLRWILETSNVGYTDELQKLYNSMSDMAKKITQNELTLPDIEKFYQQVGWHVSNFSNVSISGSFVELSGGPPEYIKRYTVLIVSGGYSDNVVYDVYRSDSSTAVESGLAGKYDEYESVDDSFLIRWDGQFATGSFNITGTPSSEVNAIERVKSIRQINLKI